MSWKKFGKALLFPHTAILWILLPVAAAFLVYSMVVLGSESTVACISYALAAYTLTVWCFRIPRIVAFVKKTKEENRYAKRWLTDAHLRVEVSLSVSFLWNAGYALLQLYLGLSQKSGWFYTVSLYYAFLAGMRLFLMWHTRKYQPQERMAAEWKKYRACGGIFLLMNLALTAMMGLMIRGGHETEHHEIITITLAAYTFSSLAAAIVGLVRYRKYNSPIFSASKAISLAAACVSMLSLESGMLTTFDSGTMDEASRRLFMILSGGGVGALMIVLAVYMIVHSTGQLRLIEAQKAEK